MNLSLRTKAFNPDIAIYLPSLEGGGAERVMVNLANGFSDRGFSVVLILANATGPYLKEVSQNVEILNLYSTGVALSLPKLIRYIRKFKPRTILSAMGHANIIALLAVKFAGVSTRIVISERNDISIESLHERGIRSWIIRTLARWLYKEADQIHCVSNGVANAISKKFSIHHDLISIVYNPVVTNDLYRRAALETNYTWLSNDTRPFILAVGRLTLQKDFSTLINAFSIVRKSSDLRLIILGDGELRELLEYEINSLGLTDSVLLPGFIENPFAVMSGAQLFVLSSSWEGLPNVLIQAMACGTPVVSTDCPSGPAEILENGKWGRLVPVGNPQLMANAIIESLHDDEHPDVAIRAAYFSQTRAIDGYLKLLYPAGK